MNGRREDWFEDAAQEAWERGRRDQLVDQLSAGEPWFAWSREFAQKIVDQMSMNSVVDALVSAPDNKESQ